MSSPTAPTAVQARGPVLALHGFAGGPQSFDALVAGSDGALWLRPSLAGHGHDPDRSAGDFVAEVDRIATWVKEHAQTPVRLLGYSMGARVGLGLCIRHPLLLQSACLVGVHPGLRDLQARRERQLWEGRWVHLLETEGLPAFLREWEKLPIFASQRVLAQDELDRQTRRRASHRADGLARAFRVLGTGVMPDFWPALATIDLPIAIVVGELDAKFLDVARQVRDLLPRGRLEVVAATGHNVLLERPEVLRGLLSSEFATGGEGL